MGATHSTHYSSTHYPNFNVLDQADAWDPHTREIVLRRMEPPPPPRHLNAAEQRTLRAVLQHLLAESRPALLNFVIAYFDDKVKPGETIGESQRPVGAPPQRDLIIQGLAALDAVAQQRHAALFPDCTHEQQFAIVAALQKGQLEAVPELDGVPQKALFKKILGLAVQAFASHPTVWSEMGYAGPAYPRGYYRIERGVADPWEAQRARDGQSESG